MLNPDKTHVGDCREPGQGFDFLGYHFEAGQRWVRRKSLNAIRERIRAKTRRTCGESLACIIAELNPMLRGWYNYFQHAHPWTFSGMDGFIRWPRPAPDGYAHCGASSRSELALDTLWPTINAGPMPTLLSWDSSR